MTSCFVHRREADEKQRAGVVTERDPYRFMSKEAAEEARMLADGMTEWELEEMRANERLPWQVRERRESEGEVKTSSDRNTSSDASDEPETNDEDEDEELESRTALAAEVVGDGDEHIPVAIPIDDDRPGYSSIFVAQVADDEDVAGLVPPAATTDAEPRVTNMATARDTESAREAAEASAAEELRVELRKMRARHGDRLAETDRAERSRRELERAADSVHANPKLGDSTHRSPVVFGTRAYDQLWAQAKAMGDAAEETGTPLLEDEDEEDERNNEEDGEYGANSVNSESVDSVSDYSYGDKENRWERASMASVGATVASTEAGELDGIDEFDETEDDETDGSGSDGTSIDGDPLDRYTVSSVAGKERGRDDADPVDANDELWGLD